jgi:hypothetical protein
VTKVDVGNIVDIGGTVSGDANVAVVRLNVFVIFSVDVRAFILSNDACQ